MSFNSKEVSIAGGRPIRFYEFSRGTLVWAYTNADRDITIGEQVYTSMAISDNGIRQTGQTTADALDITAPGDFPLVANFRGVPPSSEYNLVIRDKHFEDEETLVSWVGVIVNVNRVAMNACKITCQSLAASFERPGLHLTYQRNCPHSLYDSRCGVNKIDYAVLGVISVVTNTSITGTVFSSFDDNYFAGGFIEWVVGGTEIERRSIESNAEGVVQLFGGTEGLNVGQAVTAYPGCPQTTAACVAKFNNIDNYGGFPGLPGNSPFDGNPIA